MNKIDFEHAGLEFVAGDKFSNSTWLPTIVESFAWRTNTGVKPEFNGAIEWQAGTGAVYVNRVDELHWDLALTKWRPHLPKVEDKPKSPYDVGAHVSEAKPVFTQAMSDKEMVDLIAENDKLKSVIKILIGD